MAASLHNVRKLLSPLGGELLSTLVVSAQTVNAGLDQNQTVLGILVLLVLLQMLANADGLADQAVDVFGNLWSTA